MYSDHLITIIPVSDNLLLPHKFKLVYSIHVHVCTVQSVHTYNVYTMYNVY